jgi:hypothetical protein
MPESKHNMPQLKHYPRLKLYKYNTNLVYNPETRIATSYKWYEIYKVINGVRCLNTHAYSVTTSKHVGILRQFFNHCRDDIFYFEAPQGLQDLNSAIKYYESMIADLETLMNKPKSHVKKNLERLETIGQYVNKINRIKQLQESRV